MLINLILSVKLEISAQLFFASPFIPVRKLFRAAWPGLIPILIWKNVDVSYTKEEGVEE
jgi:hypothetical protein